jgi:hypothetical protein
MLAFLCLLFINLEHQFMTEDTCLHVYTVEKKDEEQGDSLSKHFLEDIPTTST